MNHDDKVRDAVDEEEYVDDPVNVDTAVVLDNVETVDDQVTGDNVEENANNPISGDEIVNVVLIAKKLLIVQ